jgi:hypothetical protein
MVPYRVRPNCICVAELWHIMQGYKGFVATAWLGERTDDEQPGADRSSTTEAWAPTVAAA